MIDAVDIHVKGIVQGVGFRPFVYRMAKKYLINGWVLNATDGVHIHAEGESALVDEFDFVDLISSGEAAKEKFTYLAEYNLYLKQSLYYDASSGIVICIMKNITREKQRQNMVMRHKTQVAGMADDIVDKQLRIVHEIASLLGESAAETKVAISKLKEAVMMENEEQ